MRKIQVTKWDASDGNGHMIKEDSLSVLKILLSNKKPGEMPTGLDNFRLFSRLSNAFDNAEKSGILNLEEAEYSFLKKTIEKDVPSVWAMNKNINEAVEGFINAKEE